MAEDVQTVTDVPIDPDSNNPISVDQTSTLVTFDDGGVDDDGFEVSINLQGAQVNDDRIDVAVVIDTSGSTADSSGTDFNGDGTDETILEAELIAAIDLFDAYAASGFSGDDVVFSVVTYAGDGEDRGSFTLDERDELVDLLQEIRDDGPSGQTDFDSALDATGDAFDEAGANPDGTNLVVFLSDGFPTESSDQEIIDAATALEDDYNAVINGIGIGPNSAIDKLDLLDNTPGGAVRVDNGEDLVELIVQPLTEADFLRFEIQIEGVDANGDPLTQTVTIEEDDPAVIKTPLGWAIDQFEVDPEFAAPQDIVVVVNSVFAEDPGNPGSGDQFVTTIHNVPLVICFTPGVMIRTPDGEVAIENLAAGDRVITRDHGVQTVRWIGSTTFPVSALNRCASMRPILIRKDALGPEQPAQDMRVSRQHRILVRDWRAEVMFGQPNGVLVPAGSLLNDSTILEDRPTEPVTYIHLAFDAHEVIYADGIEAESFHPSERTVVGLSPDQRAELVDLFPHLNDSVSSHAFDAARSNLKGQEARVLAGD